MRTLLRYAGLTALLLGLAWASITVKVRGQTLFAYAQEAARDADWGAWRTRASGWWTALRAATWDRATQEAAPAPRRAVPRRTADRPRRSPRDVPPTELQAEPEAAERVSILAEAAKQAAKRSPERPRRRGGATSAEKKALDALLTNREARSR